MSELLRTGDAYPISALNADTDVRVALDTAIQVADSRPCLLSQDDVEPALVIVDTKKGRLGPDELADWMDNHRKSFSKTTDMLGLEAGDASLVSGIVGEQQRRTSEGMPDARRPSSIKAMEQQGVAFAEHACAAKNGKPPSVPATSCCVLM